LCDGDGCCRACIVVIGWKVKVCELERTGLRRDLIVTEIY
jgi:hypothetical protein